MIGHNRRQPKRQQTRQPVDDQALTLLSAFQNADKHRELTVVAYGLADPVGRITFPDGTVEHLPGLPAHHMLKNGAVIVRTHVEVKVEVSGAVKVGMGRRPQGGHKSGEALGPYRELPEGARAILREGEAIVRRIEEAMTE